MKFTINITQSDINNGKRHNACKCPISLAIQRALHDDKIYVSYKDIYFQRTDRFVETPKIVLDFIKAFDIKAEVKPFKFELDI